MSNSRVQGLCLQGGGREKGFQSTWEGQLSTGKEGQNGNICPEELIRGHI